ncbi:MAG: rod shape-determining protein MreC [Desulfocapsaceae bacterium]|nr:rod shape-determining protein MreC [Desulfocapsaceae bacterium]
MVRKTNTPRTGLKQLAMTKVIFLVVLVCCLILFIASFGGRFGLFHQLTLESLGPFQSFATKISANISGVWDDYISLWEIRDENKRLRQLLVEYEDKFNEYAEVYSIYLGLSEKLKFKQREPFPSITARVVGKDPSYWFQTIIVDRGENDGIIKGMVARNENGVVGQVTQASPNYSKILLANAPSSAIDAMVQKNRVRGILKGAGQRGFTLYYVLKNADVAVGDRIVTAGIGGVFPTGIPLGRVSAVRRKQRGMFQEIEVEPAVNFQKLEVVFINLTEKLSWEAEMQDVSGEKP